jgi:hypothetical protein
MAFSPTYVDAPAAIFKLAFTYAPGVNDVVTIVSAQEKMVKVRVMVNAVGVAMLSSPE